MYFCSTCRCARRLRPAASLRRQRSRCRERTQRRARTAPWWRGGARRTASPSNADQNPGPRIPGGKLAVVNLHGSFADHHPSGIEPETLTIDSILGTLYANFPLIEQVRFLVDGQPRETLNGHADLMRAYDVVDTTSNSAQPNKEEGH